ncbi:MAG: protein kinase [Acidimicrobiia bacterium]|nr:protein kinase [Acidimicrobiia bacterium]
MEVWVLGPTVLHRDAVELSPGGLKQRTVLALLAASAGRPVPIDALIEGLYGDAAAGGARRTIATYISNLRREMGDAILRLGDSYQLDPAVKVDAVEFEKLYRSGSSLVVSDPGRAASMLRDALGLWRGHAYVDVETRSALSSEINRLDEMRLSALDARVEADLALGLHRDLVGELEALTAEHPLRESFRAHQMVALYRSGRQSDALRAFGRTRTVLAEEMGIDPSPELRELEEAILTQDPKLDVRIKASVERRAILAAELDDGAVYRSHGERDVALIDRDERFGAAVAGAAGRPLGVRGIAVYASFDSVDAAARAAGQLAGGSLRLAIDHGDVEVADGQVSGPPIRRALRLAAIAHPGQILLSADAQAVLASSPASGWTVQGLGAQDVKGLDGTTHVFQLVDQASPRSFPDLEIDRLPPPMPDDRTGAVPGYEIRGTLETDPAGTLHRAYQASVGREVILRLFRPELVSDPRFVRRFEAHAQRIAATGHAHLVPLLDYWRDPGSAFFIHRLIQGSSLRSVLNRGPVTRDEMVGYVDRIAGALRSAHDAGVVHGRLRPESVIVDSDANPYVGELGLASMLHGLVTFPADAYTAPEAIGGDVSQAADIYSLGVLVAELASGSSLPSDSSLPRLDTGLDNLVRVCTDPDPVERFQSVDEFLEAFHGATGRSTLAPDARNPYKGLAAFQEADAGDFHGREALARHLTEAVLERNLTVVVGPSGIGKSSLVRAGLVPELRRRRPDWMIVDTIPGARPFDQLELALSRVALVPPGDAVDRMRSGKLSISEALSGLMPPGSRLVLIIDQFEELFTQVFDVEVRRRFLDLVVDEATRSNPQVRLVVTIRADFFDRPMQHPEFASLLEDAVVPVPAPSREELTEIVVGPAGGVGVAVEEGLVAALVADTEQEVGGLPLLQHALTELFETRNGNRVTLESYHEAGGLSGSVGRRAEATFEDLGEEDQPVARELFLRLVTVEEQAEDTRRRVRRSELMAIGAPQGSVERVLEAFGRHRLLVFDRDASTRGPTVEVAHEALIRHWPRLRAWVDEVRDDLLTRRRVEIAAGDWVRSGEDPAFLFGGGRLEQAEGWRSRAGAIDEEGERFIVASRRSADTAMVRRRTVRRRVVTALSGALALAVTLGSFGWVQRGVAEREAITARMQELATQAEVAIDEDPDLAILLALEAYELSEQLDLERTPGEVMRALHVTTQSSRLVGQLPHGRFAAAVSPDGTLLVLDDPVDRTMVHVYDAETLALRHSFDSGGVVGALTFTPDGRELAVSFHDDWEDLEPALFDDLPGVQLFDVATWSPTESFDGHLRGWNVRFSASGQYLAVNGFNGTGIRSADQVLVDELGFVTWVPGGDIAAVWRQDEEVIEFLDVGDMSVVGSVPIPGIVVNSLSVHPDGQTMLIADGASERVIEMDIGGTIRETWDTPSVQMVGYSSEGGGFTAQGNDDRVLFVSEAGALELRGHAGGSWTTAHSIDGTQVFALMLSGGTRVWDVTVDGPPELGSVRVKPERWTPRLAPDGRTLALVTEVLSVEQDGRTFDLIDGVEGVVLERDVAVAGSSYIDAAGGFSVTTLPEQLESCELVYWEGGSPASVAVGSVCAEPGKEIARVVQVGSGAEIAEFAWAGGIAFGPEGTPSAGLLAHQGGALGAIEIVELGSGSNLGSVGKAGVFLFRPTFSTDGLTLTAGSQEGFLAVVDLPKVVNGSTADEALTLVEEGDGPTNYTTSSANFVVSSRSGELLRIRDRATLEPLYDIPIATGIYVPMIIDPGERYLYYRDGRDAASVLRRLPLASAPLAELARSRLNRDFTLDECERFLSDTDCSMYAES